MSNTLPESIAKYLDLIQKKPDLFTPSDDIPLVTDAEKIQAFSMLYNRPMGVVYSNRGYYDVVADLCYNEKRGYFSYARVIYEQSSNGAVAIPIKRDEQGTKFALLRQFRHTCRMECLEFPRGFAIQGLTPEEAIRLELSEEMGATAIQVTHLGQVRADSGLAAGLVDVFLAEVTSAQAQLGHEGIQDLLWVSEAELTDMIRRGEIQDGFTLSALTLLRCADAW